MGGLVGAMGGWEGEGTGIDMYNKIVSNSNKIYKKNASSLLPPCRFQG